jgi:hypothetical protein
MVKQFARALCETVIGFSNSKLASLKESKQGATNKALSNKRALVRSWDWANPSMSLGV